MEGKSMTTTISLVAAVVLASAWRAWCLWKLAKATDNNQTKES